MNLHGQINAACESRPGHVSLVCLDSARVFMLSYKMDFSSCGIMSGFGKSSHILSTSVKFLTMACTLSIVCIKVRCVFQQIHTPPVNGVTSSYFLLSNRL